MTLRLPCIAASFGLFCVFVACSGSPPCGAGTHDDAGTCVADTPSPGADGGAAAESGPPGADAAPWQDAGTHDAATNADGGIPLSPDDVLRIATYNGGSDMTLLVDTKICLQLTVLHSDGTKTAVAPGAGTVSITAKKTGIVNPAEATDCLTGGLLGAGAGLTALTVGLTSGGVTITGAATATVDASPIQIKPYAGTEAQAFHLAAGTTTNANVFSDEERRDGIFYLGQMYLVWGPTTGTRPRDAELVMRWMTMKFADASLANVTHLPGNHGDMWRFDALAIGATTAAIAYNGPHGTANASRAVQVVAKPAVQLPDDRIGVVLLSAASQILTDGFVHPENVAPGTCFLPRLYVYISQGPSAPLTFDLDSGVTFSEKTEGTAATKPGTNPGEVCMTGSGVTRVTGCMSGTCTTLPLSAYESGALQKFEVAALSTNPVPGSVMLMQYVFCPDLRATVTLAGGASFDVTTVAGWGFSSTQDSRVIGSLAFTPFSPPDADVASPCLGINFGASPPKGLTGPGTTAVSTVAHYEGLDAKIDVLAAGTMPP